MTKSTWKNKPLLDQRDQFNQRLTMQLEMVNGERANPAKYLSGLLNTQSLEAWNGRQDEFRDWIAKSMADYFGNLEVRIWGHSN